MNKKEMIEEMARQICPNSKTWSCKACSWGAEPNCVAYENAKTYYEKGYRKIPEGAVVLSKEEYSDYLILQTNHEWLKDKAAELQADNERLYKNLGKFKESVRKETAKEILNKLYKQINETDPKWFGAQIKIIAKKYGVKVVEE